MTEKNEADAAAAAAEKDAAAEVKASKEASGIVVSGGVRYTKKDAEARGIKPDTAAHAKKIANGDIPVGTYVPAKAGDAQAIPGPITTAGK